MKIKAAQRLFSFTLDSMQSREAWLSSEEWESRHIVQHEVVFCENFFPNQDMTGDESYKEILKEHLSLESRAELDLQFTMLCYTILCYIMLYIHKVYCQVEVSWYFDYLGNKLR